MRVLFAVFAALAVCLAAPAAAQTCALPTTGSTSVRLAAVQACLKQVLAKNASQNDEVDELQAWRASVDATLSDHEDRLDDLEGAGLQASLRPSRSSGRHIVSYNPTGLAYYAWPTTLDAQLESGLPICRYADGREATKAELAASGVIDPNTLDLIGLGPFAHCDLATFRWMAQYYPAEFDGTWVVDWTNASATLDVIRCAGSRVTTTRRIELTFAENYGEWCFVRVTAMSAGPLGLRAYQKSDEAKLAAGQRWRDDFFAYGRRADIIRTMDLQHTNMSCVKSVAEIKSAAAVTWTTHPNELCGRGLKAHGMSNVDLVGLARTLDAVIWINAPPLLGAPNSVDVVYQLPLEAWEQRALQIRAIGAASQASVLASSAWREWADDLVAALAAKNYPRTDAVYIELGNEIWNTSTAFLESTNWFQGLAQGMGGNRSTRFALGYFSAKLESEFRAALAAAGRSDQHYHIVLAGQADSPSTSEDALLGYRQYFLDRSIDPAPRMAVAGVSVAVYYFAFNDQGRNPWGAADWTALQSAMAASAAISPDNFALAMGDYLTDDAKPYGVKYAWDRYAEHCALAVQYGAVCVTPYEGGGHSQLWGAVMTPAIINGRERFSLGAQGARVKRLQITQCAARFPADQYPELGCFVDYTGPSEGDPQGDAADDLAIVADWQDGPPHLPTPTMDLLNEFGRAQ